MFVAFVDDVESCSGNSIRFFVFWISVLFFPRLCSQISLCSIVLWYFRLWVCLLCACCLKLFIDISIINGNSLSASCTMAYFNDDTSINNAREAGPLPNPAVLPWRAFGLLITDKSCVMFIEMLKFSCSKVLCGCELLLWCDHHKYSNCPLIVLFIASVCSVM